MTSSLTVGEWVVARSENGLLEVEYALFAPSEVLLAAPIAGAGVREQGYLTTAATARSRLESAGITSALAHAAFSELSRRFGDLLRAPSLARVIDQLEPCEIFQGTIFDAKARNYEGAWLDLAALANACGLEDSALAMQALHLVMVCEESPPDAPIKLLSSGDETRAGERTWRKVSLENAQDLPRALAAVGDLHLTSIVREADVIHALIDDLRARSSLETTSRARLHALASALSRNALSSRPPPPNAPPPTALNVPDVIITDDLDYEPVPLIAELHAHAEMIHGELRVREVAHFLTAMTEKRASAPELAILAGRAWLASGEIGYARYFARRVAEDPTATLSARIAAIEILESTTRTNESLQPPPGLSMMPLPVVILEMPDKAPPGASLPPFAAEIDPPPPSSVDPPPSRRVEVVETMTAPENDPTRMRMTQLSRELARDYRLAYGTTLKTNPTAIEAMQKHLRRRFGDAKQDERVSKLLDAELTRHGALLSEILIRMLGGQWVDVTNAEVGRWAMIVPPHIRVWPIGRVYRFFMHGHEEADLVEFYFELAEKNRS